MSQVSSRSGARSHLSPYLKALTCLFVVAGFGLLSKSGVEFSEPPSLDFIQVLSSSLGFSGAPDVPVTLIKVDDETFDEWGRPFPIRKAKLVEVLETLKAPGPLAVILDYDLSVETDEADQSAFSALLAAWPATAPSLLLPRELASTEGGTTAVPTPFDDLVDKNSAVTWTSVRFTRDSERKVRTWRLWEEACGEGKVYLSPVLILRALQANPETPVDGATSSLADGLRSCGNTEMLRWPEWLRAQTKTGPVNYVLGAQTRTTQVVPNLGVAAIEEWSANDVVSKGLAAEAMNDRVLIVGASHGQSGDWHLTPVGSMEGMRILANAISDGPTTLSAARAGPAEHWFLVGIFVVTCIVFHQLFRAVVFAACALLTLISVYAFSSHTYGPITAIEVAGSGINALLVYLALESIFSILISVFVDRQGWRSILNS